MYEYVMQKCTSIQDILKIHYEYQLFSWDGYSSSSSYNIRTPIYCMILLDQFFHVWWQDLEDGQTDREKLKNVWE